MQRQRRRFCLPTPDLHGAAEVAPLLGEVPRLLEVEQLRPVVVVVVHTKQQQQRVVNKQTFEGNYVFNFLNFFHISRWVNDNAVVVSVTQV